MRKEVNIYQMMTNPKPTPTNDWSRFYFPEVLPALNSNGEGEEETGETPEGKRSQTPENQPGQEFRWATLRRAALESPDFQKFLGELIQSDIHSDYTNLSGNEERYQRLLNYLIKGMCRFPSLSGFDWDMYKLRTTACLICLEAAGYITKKEYIK